MLILASQSPRRRRLLMGVGVTIEIRPVDIDESQNTYEAPEAFVLRLAEEKARASLSLNKSKLADENNDMVLGADTIVVLDGEIIGKPRDRAHAFDMLSKLSGRTHHVYTGVCVLDSCRGKHCDVVCTPVTFRSLPKQEIEDYLDTDEPYDKAGSYAIQGKGGVMVDRVEGSYSNIIGLPIKETLELIKKAGEVL